MQKVLVALVLVAIVGGGAFFLSKDDKTAITSNQANTQTAAVDNEEQADLSDEASDSNTITFNEDGFNPKTLTVKSGDTVTIKNDSSRTIQFESDPHPAHTENTELNIDTIRPGQSKSFTANRTGTFGYHDHLDASAEGTIIVQ